MKELEQAVDRQTQSQQILADELFTLTTKRNESHRLQKCPYRQDLKFFCGEQCGAGNAFDCPIYFKETGRLALARRGEY